MMGSRGGWRRGVKGRAEGGYYMWDGASRVPGLGYHIRDSYHEDNIYEEWRDETSDNMRQTYSTSAVSFNGNMEDYPVLKPSLLDQYNRQRICDSYSSTCDSQESTSSTDSNQQKDGHIEISIVNSLPNFSNRFCVSIQKRPNIKNTHKKLQRCGGQETKGIEQSVTSLGFGDVNTVYNNFSYINAVDTNQHPKLSRKDNIAKNSLHWKSNEIETKLCNKRSPAEKIDMPHNNAGDYSYAYRWDKSTNMAAFDIYWWSD
jgi:hypothetical protein